MIKNKAKVNEVVSDAAMLKRYRNQIKEMERKMKEVPLISLDRSNMIYYELTSAGPQGRY